MKKLPSILIPLCIAALPLGCAHAPTDDLVNARQTFKQAASGPASELAPADLYEAKKALSVAERAHERNPGSTKERDLAYIAARRAEYAIASANMKKARMQAKEAETSRITTLQDQRDRTRQELQQAESQLGAREQALQDQERALQQAQSEREQLQRRLSAATASLEGMADIKQEENRMILTLNGSVLFKHDSADLLDIAEDRLREVAAVLKEYDDGNKKIVIEGYTDAVGSKSYNRKLSQQRANSVRKFLVQEGVSEQVVTAIGFGETDPVATNATPEGRANNRRVEIVIEGKPGTTQGGEDVVGRNMSQGQGQGQGQQSRR